MLPDLFTLAASLQFAPPAGDGPRRFTMTAYDGGLLQLPNVPVPVVVDLTGMRQADQVKALLHHDPTRPVGHMDRVDIGHTRIETDGVLSVTDNAAHLIQAQQAGFEWESSIGAQILDKEIVPRGRSVEVNGRAFQGPLIVARKTLLREVSFTGAGAGNNTSATIAAMARPFHSLLSLDPFLMDPATNPSNPATPPATPPAVPPAPSAETAALQAQVVRLEASMQSMADAFASQTRAWEEERTRAQRQQLTDSIDRLAREYHCDNEEILASLRQQAQAGEIAESDIELRILRASGDGRLSRFLPIGARTGAPTAPHVIEAALQLTCGWDERDLAGLFDENTINAALDRKFQGFGLHALGVEYLHAHGHHVVGGKLGDDDIKELTRLAESEPREIRASGGFSTISLPGILSNVARKEMLRAYDGFRKAILTVSKTTTATDYKPFHMYRLHTGGLLQQVGADGELKSMELVEDEYQSRVYPWGRKIAITNVMWKNDDAGAFTELTRLFGLSAARTLERTGFTALLAQQSSFWTTGKGNRLAPGAGSALGLDSLRSAYTLFLQAKDSTGEPIGIAPRTLLTGSTNHLTAMDLNKFDRVNLAVVPDASSAANEIIERTSGNPFRGMFDPQSSPYLDAGMVPNANGTQWLLCADPAVTAPLVVAFLDGRRAPRVRPWEALPGKLGMQWDIDMSFGFNLHDDKAAIFSPGQ